MKKYMYFLHGEVIISENKVSIHFTFSALLDLIEYLCSHLNSLYLGPS